MPIGDDATAAGYALVPDTGEEGRVRWGAREINRTRDYLALVKALIPTSKAGYRTASGIKSGKFTKAFTADNRQTGTLTFPAPFTATPVLVAVVQCTSNHDILFNIGSMDAALCNYVLFQKDGTAITETVTVHWVAIGT